MGGAAPSTNANENREMGISITGRSRTGGTTAHRGTAVRVASSAGWLVALFGIDPRTLALFRVLLGTVLCYDIGQRLFEFSAMYTESGVMPQSVVRSQLGPESWTWSLFFLSTASWYQGLLLGLTLAAGVAIVLGFRTRTALLAAWALIASLHARAPATVIGGDVLLGLLLLWSIFLPLGATWSLDGWRRPRPDAAVLHVAGGAAMGLMAAMYFMTGISKSNTIWISGQALHNVFQYGLIARPPARVLERVPFLLTVGSWWTLAIELAAPALFFSPWRTRLCRRIALWNFVFLHLAVEATMCVIIFSYVSLAGLSLFLDRASWEKGWGHRLAARLDRWFHGGKMQREAPRRVPRTSNLLAVGLLAVVVFVNAPFFVWRGDFIYHLAPPAQRLAELFGCCCRFDMFGTPAWPDYRFVAAAETDDGRVIDLLRDGRPVNLDQIAALEPSTPSHRWLGFYVDLMRPEKAAFRRTFAQFVWHRWQAQHPAEPIKNVRLLVVLASSPEGTPAAEEKDGPPGLLLAVFDPLVEGRYAGGKREGPFTVFHAPGIKAAEGTYRNDLPVGQWKYYDSTGRLEGEGEYVDGQMHGRWVFHYPGGRTTEAWFDHGRRIPPPAR